jgi:hypothetical protein
MWISGFSKVVLDGLTNRKSIKSHDLCLAPFSKQGSPEHRHREAWFSEIKPALVIVILI